MQRWSQPVWTATKLLTLARKPAGHWRHDVICGEGVELARISDDADDLRHGRERRRIELGGAAGDEDPRVGPATMRAADRLARLAHGLVGHRAAVDDDPVLARRRAARAIVSLSAKLSRQPSVIVSTLIAAPRGRARPRRHASRCRACGSARPAPRRSSAMPPGMSTLTGDCARLVAIAATAVAQAPVPQASVSPGAALPGPQFERRRRRYVRDVDVDPLGKGRVVLDPRPELVERRSRRHRRRRRRGADCRR